MAARALIIGAPRSGSGKTTLTLALLAALRRRGLRVRAAKSGPDYIDPAFHAAASGAPCPNLDSWAMAPAQLDCIAADVAMDADVVLIESAMGLFDGVAAAPGRSGAAADLAARYRLPVLLVLDVSGQSQTAAAVARGFMLHDPAVRIAGVVLNRVGSDRHRDSIARAMAALGLPLLGSVPRDSTIALPERHLGLVQAGEHGGLADLLERLADLAERTLDLDGILTHAASWQPKPSAARMLPPPGQRIALACDAAFSFVYPHLLSAWRLAGAEIVPFSPLADAAPRDDCDTCWLPGGYPELHGATLANAANFRAGMRRFAQTRPVHGECGGYMVTGVSAARCRRGDAPHARPDGPCHELCPPADASRLPRGDPAAPLRRWRGGHGGAGPRIPLRQRHRSWHGRAAGDAERCGGPGAGAFRWRSGAGQRLVLSCDCAGFVARRPSLSECASLDALAVSMPCHARWR